MSGTFPTTPKPKEMGLGLDEGDISTFSVSKRRQHRISRGQLWLVKVDYPVMERANFSKVFSFFAKQRGEDFKIQVPPYNNSGGSLSGNPTHGSASKGATSVTLSGMSGGIIDGDMFTFSGHSKVYMATADRTGNGTLNFTPALIESVGGGTATFNGCEFTMAIDGSINQLSVRQPTQAAYSINLKEST